MTFSTPIKIIVACFVVATLLVATTISGSKSAELKGSRKLQGALSATDAVNNIISNSDSIIDAINPANETVSQPGAATVAVNTVNAQAAQIFPLPGAAAGAATDAVNSIISNSNNIINAFNPVNETVSQPGAATVAVNTVNAQAAQIFQGFNTTTASNDAFNTILNNFQYIIP